MFQVLSEPLGQLPSEGPWLHAGSSHSSVKPGLFREIYSKNRVWAVSEDERLHQNIGWLVFISCVISWANKWEDYSNYLVGISTTGSRPLFGLLWSVLRLS